MPEQWACSHQSSGAITAAFPGPLFMLAAKGWHQTSISHEPGGYGSSAAV